MGLRKGISYQWQMFILMVSTLWVLIFGMAYWQYSNEQKYRRKSADEQLDIINRRIVVAFEEGTELEPFINFLADYYQRNPRFDRIRISTYVNDSLIHHIGDPIYVSNNATAGERGEHKFETLEDIRDHNYYFNDVEAISRRGHMHVYTVLPFDADIRKSLLPDGSMWLVVICLAIGLTVGAFYMARHFGRNITILREFAKRAATDPNFMPPMNYPHDELGEILRQIIHMYNERSKAVLKLKREHKVALHAMEEKARLKRQLTNNINHELKTPIGVIKGYLDTIIENPDMDAASREHFQFKAREHVNRLVNLIADVSAITRLEDGSGMINTEPIDYHDVVYTVGNDLEESGVLDKLEFVYDVPLDCMVKGNYNLLSGMLINLAKNAAAYSRGTECGVKLLEENNQYYTFCFYDNGVGVPEESLPHLFERFYRIDSGRSRKAGGTGLGLPIVQSTIEAHGGTIEARNGESGGLMFIYSLPKSFDH